MSLGDSTFDLSGALAAGVIRFCRALRDRGLPVTTVECIDAVTALPLIDLLDRQELYLALRAVLTSRPEDFPVFDELFERFLQSDNKRHIEASAAKPAGPTDRRRRPREHSREAPSEPGMQVLVQNWLKSVEGKAAGIDVPGLSNRESIDRKDLSAFKPDEFDEIERAARVVVKKLAARPSRRWQPSRSQRRVDLRRTIRRSLRTGGDPISPAFREHKNRKTRLVVLCDVSGSMDIYSRFLLQFVYALQNSFARVESFIFSTTVERITGHLRRRSYAGALDQMSAEVRGWSGGTKIGSSVAAINRVWPRMLDRRTIVIILSDGWDTDEPELLARELQALKRRAGRLIWLNPLLGSSGYQPLTRGMQSALAFVDVFAAAHNVASLRALAPHLAL